MPTPQRDNSGFNVISIPFEWYSMSDAQQQKVIKELAKQLSGWKPIIKGNEEAYADTKRK